MAGADFLNLDARNAPSGELARWLTGSIRSAIRSETLVAGTALPATRSLAADLGVARGVVVEAYGRLGDEGLVQAGPRRGTIVRPTLLIPKTRSGPPRATPAGKSSAAVPLRFDLSPNVPDLTLFPRTAWVRAEREVLRRAGAADLGYGDPAGSPVLRQELAGWLARMRGLHLDPAELMIVSGVAQALAILATVLVRDGRERMGVEDPGSRGAIDQVAYWGARPVPIGVDASGIDVAQLQAAGPDSVLVTLPTSSLPGVVLDPDRRRELLSWAGTSGALVIEDDYDADQRYDRSPVPALHASAPDLVAYTGSASKSLAPGLRLGWLVVPQRMREATRAAKYASDISSSVLPQLVLAQLIANGTYEQCLRRARTRQRDRRDAMIAALQRHVPAASVDGIAAGLHLTVTFENATWSDSAVADGLETNGLRVDPLSRHRSRPGSPGFVVGYAAHPPDRIEEAVALLAEAVVG